VWRRRPRPQSQPVPLALPRLDCSSWPPTAERPSFEASTYHEIGLRRAHEPDAHALADRLLEAALSRVSTQASAEDEPYLHKVLRTAAQVGAGLGLVDPSPPGLLDPGVAGALGVARRGLPTMQPDWALLGAWFLAAGHFLARHDAAARDAALAALVDEL
jgi:hypothetical protein